MPSVLDMMFNNLGDEGTKQIAEILKVNRSIDCLGLGVNSIGGKTIVLFIH